MESTFLEDITPQEKRYFQNLHDIILSQDRTVKAEVGKIMSADKTVNYLQDGVFKYGLAKTDKHFSFHSMVMYAYPEIANWVKDKKLKVKVQKGCINFTNISDFPVMVFEEMIHISAKKDFSVVMKAYKKA